MQVSVRSPLAAGVALVCASAIAISPIAAPAPDVQLPAIHASAVSVELSALTNPLQLWGEVFGTAGQHIGGLGEVWLADPAPILTQILANQLHSANVLSSAAQTTIDGFKDAFAPEGWMSFPAALQEGFDLIAAGQYETGFTAVASSFLLLGLPLIGGVSEAWPAIAQPFENLAHLVQELPVNLPALVVNGLLGPLTAVAAASGHTLEELAGAATNGEVAELVSTLVNAPATLTGALLNGYEIHGTMTSGLLNAPQGWIAGGAIATVLSALAGIADSIATPGADRQDVLGSVTDLPGFTALSPDPGAASTALVAKTVTLDVATELDDASATAGTATEPAAEITTAAEVKTEIKAEVEVEPAAATTTEVTAPDEALAEAAIETAELGTTGTKPARPAQKLRASLKDAGDQVNKRLNGIRTNVKNSLKNLSGRDDKPARGESAADGDSGGSSGDSGGSSGDSGGSNSGGNGSRDSGSDSGDS